MDGIAGHTTRIGRLDRLFLQHDRDRQVFASREIKRGAKKRIPAKGWAK